MNIKHGLFRVWVAASITWAAPVGYLAMQSADLRDVLSYEDAVKRGVDEDKGPHFDITECRPAWRVRLAVGSVPALLAGVRFLGAWIARGL